MQWVKYSAWSTNILIFLKNKHLYVSISLLFSCSSESSIKPLMKTKNHLQVKHFAELLQSSQIITCQPLVPYALILLKQATNCVSTNQKYSLSKTNVKSKHYQEDLSCLFNMVYCTSKCCLDLNFHFSSLSFYLGWVLSWSEPPSKVISSRKNPWSSACPSQHWMYIMYLLFPQIVSYFPICRIYYKCLIFICLNKNKTLVISHVC